jgi:hypothetical protein
MIVADSAHYIAADERRSEAIHTTADQTLYIASRKRTSEAIGPYIACLCDCVELIISMSGSASTYHLCALLRS